jgi:hypothetical protein
MYYYSLAVQYNMAVKYLEEALAVAGNPGQEDKVAAFQTIEPGRAKLLTERFDGSEWNIRPARSKTNPENTG